MLDIDLLSEWLTKLEIEATDAQHEKMSAFLQRLYEVNKTQNLTRVPPEAATIRHVVDSLLISPYIPHGSSVLDIGTGSGFPAMPLAIYRPDLKITAWDGSERPLVVLREFPLENLKIEKVRAESQQRAEFDVVTGRALAPYPIQAEVSIPQLRVEGLFIPLRTVRDQEDIQKTAHQLLASKVMSEEEVVLQEGDAVRLFPIVRKHQANSARYPRPWADMKRKPLYRKVKPARPERD